MRRAAIAGLLALFALAGPTQAASYTYTHVANAPTDFRFDFTTATAGDVTAHIVWTPKAHGGYTLNLRRNAVCAQNATATEVYVIQTVTQPNGDWTIAVPGAAPTASGECWSVQFWPYSGGRVTPTLTVTTPD